MRFTTSSETWRAWEGRVVDGKFTLGQWLGGSDHSAVFATERKDQRSTKAVIKLIASEPGQSEVQLSRWGVSAQLTHPNVIRIFESGQCRLDNIPLLYIVMEQAEEDLSQILPQRALSAEETGDVLPPMLEGLAYLHGKGFVHGHVRPSNVHAVGDQVKLSADQITSIADTNSARRRRDVYDAPETAAGILSPASDVWSLGVTLMAALTQNVPQDGEASRGDPGLPATIPEPFLGIVRECLHLDPQQRCTIAQIRARLAPAPSAAPMKPHVETPRASAAKTNRAPIFVAVAVLLALIGIFALWKGGSSHSSGTEQPAAQTAAPETASPQNTPAETAPPTASAKSAQPAKNAPVARGEVVHQVLPDISASARRTITGTIKIKVRVEVNASGKVMAAKLAAPVSSRYFADHTLQAAKAWEFSPLQVDGQPRPSAWLLQFRIQRGGTHATAERITR